MVCSIYSALPIGGSGDKKSIEIGPGLWFCIGPGKIWRVFTRVPHLNCSNSFMVPHYVADYRSSDLKLLAKYLKRLLADLDDGEVTPSDLVGV